ncbi:MAG: amidohydrolase family protein [Acidimicrobiia bacterium]|nr:amidohydrolase family protein [Acidimicrobiia bacterium]
MTTELDDVPRQIIDPHHHLWGPDYLGGLAGSYQLEELRADTDTVPGVTATMFMECGASYRTDGPEHLRPAGETEFVAGLAEASERSEGITIIGIVGFADLTLPLELLDEVLDAHVAAAGGRFRGIRDALASAPPDAPLIIPGGAAPGRGADPDFRRGVAHLGQRGLTYDTWQYHTQMHDFLDLARAVPDTVMVLDHLCTPLGVGAWAGRHDEIFEEWKPGIAALAGCPNVVAKLGGLAMPDNGFWPIDNSVRPGVDEFLAVQERWYAHALECFGPERCMFESNFPVDKFCVDYEVVWAAFERIAARFDPTEQDALFAGTAQRVYDL